MKKYTYLLFDADGTLFDYEKAEIIALENTFKKFHLPFDTAILQTYKDFNDKLWEDFEHGLVDKETLKTERFKRLFSVLSVSCDIQKFSDTYLTELGKGTFLLEYAQTISEVLALKYQLAIVTNGIDSVQKSRMALSSIGTYFPSLFTSEAVGFQKPDVGFFDKVFLDMNISQEQKNEVLIIGDSLSADIKGGMNYGIDTCWVNPQAQKNTLAFAPTYEIKSLRELLDFL